MKKLIVLLIITALLVSPINADIVEPGVKGEKLQTGYEYKEVIFLTGEPIELKGTLKLTESQSGGKKKTTLDYTLSNTAKRASLKRKLVFTETAAVDESKQQTGSETIVDPKVTEAITIGGQSYTLRDYIFSKSAVTDNKNVIKYTSGFWNGMKRYTDAAGTEILVDVSADSYKYENYWSTVETALIKNVITYKRKKSATSTTYIENTGTVEYGVTNTKKKEVLERKSQPSAISFKESFVLSEEEENTVAYTYDLPDLKSSITTKRKTGEGSYTMSTLPVLKPLPIPKYTDITGYWAEGDIKKLFSLDVISGESSYYNPLVPINRAEFAKAIVNACGIMKEEEARAASATAKRNTKTPPEPPISFTDVKTDLPNYKYIQKAVNTGIMKGVDINRFDPDGYLTKAQAVTTIVRALGLEDMNLTGSRPPFADESSISNWAKKSLYVAYDMGIIDVNEYGMVQSNRTLTRGEAANLINRFITYLQKKIITDYRERIVNFR